MLEKQDVIIVSIYGRGHWLAQDLAGKGLKVALVDVSEKMGRWSSEDREGPFGYFRGERLSSSQIERLISDEVSEPVVNGFTVWLNDGPVELKGPVTSHSLKMHGLSDECVHYLQKYHLLSNKDAHSLKQSLLGQEFSQNWLAQMAHYLSATEPLTPSRALAGDNNPLPLFDSFFVRRPSWRGADRSLDECRRKGVKVLAEADVLDVSIQRKTVEGIEVKSEVHSGVVFAEEVIWTLSSEESQRLSERVHSQLFPEGPLAADWLWMRFRLVVEEHPSLQELPVCFVSLEDRYLDWSGNNCCINLRTVKNTDIDVWTKVPQSQRFHRAYIENLCQKICENLSARLGGLKVECLNWPQDYTYEYDQVGAPRFPVYEKGRRSSLNRLKLTNLFYDGPEDWKGLDWLSQFEAQELIFKQIVDRQKREGQTGDTFLQERNAEV